MSCRDPKCEHPDCVYDRAHEKLDREVGKYMWTFGEAKMQTPGRKSGKPDASPSPLKIACVAPVGELITLCGHGFNHWYTVRAGGLAHAPHGATKCAECLEVLAGIKRTGKHKPKRENKPLRTCRVLVRGVPAHAVADVHRVLRALGAAEVLIPENDFYDRDSMQPLGQIECRGASTERKPTRRPKPKRPRRSE